MSPLDGKKVKPSNKNVVLWSFTPLQFFLLFCQFLAHENKKYLFEIKESLLIMREKASLNMSINSAPLYLFYSLLRSFSLFHISLFNLFSLFLFKYHYKTLKMKLPASIKYDLIIGRNMPETLYQKNFNKNLD